MSGDSGQNVPTQRQVLPVVRVAPLGELRVYQITEDELDALHRGQPSDLFLNLALSLLSIAISFFVALATAQFTSDRAFYVFVIVACVTSIAGIVLFCLWWRHRSDAKDITQTIKRRMPPQPIIDDVDSDSAEQ